MLLDIQDLSIRVAGPQGARIVTDLNLQIGRQEIVGLVGGSGSGKTTTGLAVLRLLAPGLRIISGKIFFEDADILGLTENAVRSVRGKKIAMVFQEPLNAFNPVFTIGYQIAEVLRYHTAFKGEKRAQRVRGLLFTVGIKEPARVAASYPHQLSGGMRQRAMIAQAIAAEPKLLIADEPTSNLDVTLQARIIELFEKLRMELGLSVLLVTHDLGAVRHLTDRVAVLKQGRLVESGNTAEVIAAPRAEYTRQLLEVLE